MEQQPQLNDHNKQKFPPMHAHESDVALNDVLEKVPTTAEILLYKLQNLNINTQWVHWSIDMLEAGYETENLIILAGEDLHCNPFEFKALTDKVFEELHLDKITPHRIFIIYSMYIIKQAIKSPDEENISKSLFKLEQLCIENNYNSILYEFYLLSNAIGELEAFDVQWYWSDATLTKENWCEYALNYLEQWMSNPIQENLDKRQNFSEKVITSKLPKKKKNIFRKMISFFAKK